MPVSEVHQRREGEDGLAAREARVSRDVTRRRITDVALELIADRGFAATSTREISERLGFTKAALYYHFRTKDDLLAAIVAPAVDDLAALVAGAPEHPSEPDRRRLEGYVELVRSHQDLVRVLSDDPSARRRPALAAALPLYQRLMRLLSGVPEGDVPDVVRRTRVRAALGAVHSAVLRAPPDDDPAAVHAAALAAACGALGIAAPRAAPNTVPGAR